MYIDGNNALKHSSNIITVCNDQEQAEDKREERRYFVKQKLGGLLAIIIGVMQPFLMDGDVTLSALMIPLGIVLLLTKEKAFTY